MKKIVLIILILLTTNLYAQKKVIGRVFNRKEQPIGNVKILIKGTTVGTTSNHAGYFEIEYKEDIELIASHMGYDTVSFMLPKADIFKFYMDRSLIKLPEFDVRSFYKDKKYPIGQEQVEDFEKDLVAEGILEADARYKGGQEGMYNYFGENFSSLTIPNDTVHLFDELVIVHFTVDKEGKIKNISLSGETRFGLGEQLNALISNMPDWKPAIHKGQAIDQDFVLGIRFNEDIFLQVQEQPAFPGGMEAFEKYLQESIIYPKEAKKMGIEGRLFAEFIVDKQGNVAPESVKVIKGISPDLDAEAIRIIKNSPKWQPGRQNGIPVLVKIAVPVLFRLTGRNKW